MKFLLNIPIRRKLTIINMLSSGIALLLVCAAFVAYEQATFRQTMRRDFAILADMFDDNAAPGLAFNDPSSVEQTLSTLSAHTHIIAACVFDRFGKVVASYKRKDHPPKFPFPKAEPTSTRFLEDRLDVFKDINPTGELIGTVYIAADLTEIDERFRRFAVIISLVLFACTMVAFALSSRLQGVISEPIVNLARTARLVAADRNYQVRAERHGEDEIGQLIDGFNEMLSQIETRDSALQDARDTLEKRVEERTSDLRRENLERKRSEQALLESKRFLQNTLDALSAHIAILDEAGNIVAVNALWTQLTGDCAFLKDGEGVGANYLELCDAAGRGGIGSAEVIARGIRGVIARTNEAFELEFPSSKDPLAPWYLVRATRFVGEGPVRVVVAHENIASRKKAEADLEQSNRQLVKASRMAGMAEVATGVLHNVGNVLNSVNVSATVISETVEQSRVIHLKKAVLLFEQNANDLAGFFTTNPKGKQLPNFLALLAKNMSEEQENVLHEMEQLRKNLEHIKDIVAMQQSYAKVSGVSETIEIRELIEDTLRMHDGAFARHQIELIRDFSATPPVTVDKHKVLQILINLVRNAKYACDASHRSDKKLTVRISNDEQWVSVSVSDKGIGISPENLTKIFAHGFTTKKDGHGFGLHSGALAAREMGGELTVQSEGVGTGATFTLSIPLHPMKAAA